MIGRGGTHRRAARRRPHHARGKRTLFNRVLFIVENDLIDLAQGEAGDLDRRVGEDQLLEFDFEFGEIPLAFLAQAIDRQPQGPLLRLRQMIHADAGQGGKTQQLRPLDPDFTVEDHVVLADEDGSAEPELADRAGDLAHMRRVALADLARRRTQIIRRDAHHFELRQHVIAHRARRRRRLGEAREVSRRSRLASLSCCLMDP